MLLAVSIELSNISRFDVRMPDIEFLAGNGYYGFWGYCLFIHNHIICGRGCEVVWIQFRSVGIYLTGVVGVALQGLRFSEFVCNKEIQVNCLIPHDNHLKLKHFITLYVLRWTRWSENDRNSAKNHFECQSRAVYWKILAWNQAYLVQVKWKGLMAWRII